MRIEKSRADKLYQRQKIREIGAIMNDMLYNLKFVYMDNFDIDGVDINLVRFLDNHEEVRKTLEKSLMDWMETEAMEYLTQMIECE